MTVYGGSEDAVDHGEVDYNAACRDALAGPKTSVGHRNVLCLRLQEESAKENNVRKIGSRKLTRKKK